MIKEQKEIINEAYLRANSIDAVRGLAYRNGHITESEELDRARRMILKLIVYINKVSEEQNPCNTCGYEEGSIYCIRQQQKNCYEPIDEILERMERESEDS